MKKIIKAVGAFLLKIALAVWAVLVLLKFWNKTDKPPAITTTVQGGDKDEADKGDSLYKKIEGQ